MGRADLKLTNFTLNDPTGRVIDVQATFAPEPIWRSILIRASFLGLTLISMIYSIVSFGEKWIWAGYLTHWGVIFAIIYQAISLMFSLKPSMIVQPPHNEQPSVLIKFNWVIYSLATVFEITITFLYWFLIYSGESLTFLSVFVHGPLALILILDGSMISKIPVRLKHITWIESVAILYLIWNVIHSLTDIGVSSENNLGRPLYSVMNWQDLPKSAVIYSAFILLVLIPLIFLLIWTLSIFSGRCKFDGSNRKFCI